MKIIGVHKGGVKLDENSVHFESNGGKLITKELLEILQLEVERMKGEYFKFEKVQQMRQHKKI